MQAAARQCEQAASHAEAQRERVQVHGESRAKAINDIKLPGEAQPQQPPTQQQQRDYSEAFLPDNLKKVASDIALPSR